MKLNLEKVEQILIKKFKIPALGNFRRTVNQLSNIDGLITPFPIDDNWFKDKLETVEDIFSNKDIWKESYNRFLFVCTSYKWEGLYAVYNSEQSSSFTTFKHWLDYNEGDFNKKYYHYEEIKDKGLIVVSLNNFLSWN